MQNADRLVGPKLKIERANSHIGDLVARDQSFFYGDDGPPYTIRREVYSKDPAQECFKCIVTRQIPDIFPIIVGEIIHNLRSAFDHLVCLLARQNSVKNTRSLHFPIGRDREHFEHPKTQEK